MAEPVNGRDPERLGRLRGIAILPVALIFGAGELSLLGLAAVGAAWLLGWS